MKLAVELLMVVILLLATGCVHTDDPNPKPPAKDGMFAISDEYNKFIGKEFRRLKNASPKHLSELERKLSKEKDVAALEYAAVEHFMLANINNYEKHFYLFDYKKWEMPKSGTNGWEYIVEASEIVEQGADGYVSYNNDLTSGEIQPNPEYTAHISEMWSKAKAKLKLAKDADFIAPSHWFNIEPRKLFRFAMVYDLHHPPTSDGFPFPESKAVLGLTQSIHTTPEGIHVFIASIISETLSRCVMSALSRGELNYKHSADLNKMIPELVPLSTMIEASLFTSAQREYGDFLGFNTDVGNYNSFMLQSWHKRTGLKRKTIGGLVDQQIEYYKTSADFCAAQIKWLSDNPGDMRDTAYAKKVSGAIFQSETRSFSAYFETWRGQTSHEIARAICSESFLKNPSLKALPAVPLTVAKHEDSKLTFYWDWEHPLASGTKKEPRKIDSFPFKQE